MPNLPPLPIGDILAVAGGFLFMIWFLLILSALTVRRHRLASAIALWILLLVVRIFIGVYVYATPSMSFKITLIAEPLNTYLFFATGALLILIFVLLKNRRPASTIVRSK